MDRLTADQRSAVMARVRGKNTKPEMIVRRTAHKMGFRFRLHRPDLPGKPDIVFPRLSKIIFVNGCFWHAHQCKHGRRIPTVNRGYWIQKRRRNATRDRLVERKLSHLGWKVLTLWECEIAEESYLIQKLKNFLSPQLS
ncbi:MAG: very short patch repair endonuclease [Phycisphaerae bacterium]